jgi:hypothetical protein
VKLLVETTGQFALHDTIGRQTVEAFRPCVVTSTPFIESNRAGKLNVIEALADDASDADLAAAKNDDELLEAIEALPRPKAAPAKPHPLDHDGDGRKGGSKPKGK